jgi:hypothetical protein
MVIPPLAQGSAEIHYHTRSDHEDELTLPTTSRCR